MYSLVPQILHMKEKTPNSYFRQNRSPSFSLSRWLSFFSLSIWPHRRPSPPRRPTAQGTTQKWISYTKLMGSNPEMGKENPEKKSGGGCGRRKEEEEDASEEIFPLI